MPINHISDVEFGEDLPVFEPDTSLETVKTFATLVGWGGARFSDHEAARKEGFPGAIVPGILSQGYLVAMIHHWAPSAEVVSIDTIFRAAVIADESHQITGVVTDINEEEKQVEIDITVVNGKGETRVFGTATVVI
ncbi:MAG: acyl dehydratase [Candidatus Azotimanducaceae bacterium]|jgi:acyl dehydratase